MPKREPPSEEWIAARIAERKAQGFDTPVTDPAALEFLARTLFAEVESAS